MNILITGNCGFIGSCAQYYFLEKGHKVFGIDDLSRPTSKLLSNTLVEDVNNIERIDFKADFVIHLAAQVSVVDSILDPYKDFWTNNRGTFMVVQWAKKNNAKVIYSSTNKVFGSLKGILNPILDSQPLNPQTNYGVSKCAGAISVIDNGGWALHQSCIYGPSQVGDENQGWIGWIRQRVKNNLPIICYGNGKQIRDLLHVHDLIRCYEMIMEGKIKSGGYVCGGGVENAYSVEEVVDLFGGKISEYKDWRLHDQKYFVSANEGLLNQGWKPNIMFENIYKDLLNGI